MQKFHIGQLLLTRGVHQRMGESSEFAYSSIIPSYAINPETGVIAAPKTNNSMTTL
jgi:hypothetical protein